MPGRPITIKRQLMTVIMVTTSIVLLLTATAFIVYDLVNFRRALVKHLTTRAQILAYNSTAVLMFRNTHEAEVILSSLQADPHITAAALYDRDGHLFVRYPASESPASFPRAPATSGHYFGEDFLVVYAPVVEKGTWHGTFYLRSNLNAIDDRLRSYGGIIIVILAGSLLLAYVISNTLQRGISIPIRTLADTAQAVSQRRDYSVRARKFRQDEIGLLIDAFNHMLTQIQERDTALRSSGERLRLALEASQTGTWDWDLIEERIIWDEYLPALFGLLPAQFDGTFSSFLDMVHPEDRAVVQHRLDSAIREGKEIHLAFRAVWPDHSVHHMASRGRAFYDGSGRAVRMAGVTLDVTQLHQAEEEIRRLNAELEQRVRDRTAELEAANEELEAFTYSVAHDLRAPLRHIDAYAQILQEDFSGALDDDARQHLSAIRRGTQNMGRLVDDLLHLAGVGRQKLNYQLTDLNTVVDEVLAECRPELGKRSVEWKIGHLPKVECDSGLIRQVFANLISNAVKYTRPKPHAKIELAAVHREGQPAIMVRDNGVGFSMQYVDKLFGVFERLHRAEEFEGTGVGLATVKRILLKHGGRIWADAAPGQGAAFYFTLETMHALPDRDASLAPSETV